jgi:hypothetical protein
MLQYMVIADAHHLPAIVLQLPQQFSTVGFHARPAALPASR